MQTSIKRNVLFSQSVLLFGFFIMQPKRNKDNRTMKLTNYVFTFSFSDANIGLC